jgi:hypothetical protein
MLHGAKLYLYLEMISVTYFLLTVLHADDDTTVWCTPPAPMGSEGPGSTLLMWTIRVAMRAEWKDIGAGSEGAERKE